MKYILLSIWMACLHTLAAQTARDTVNIYLDSNNSIRFSKKTDFSKDVIVMVDTRIGCTEPTLYTLQDTNEIGINPYDPASPAVFLLPKGQPFERLKIKCNGKDYLSDLINNTSGKSADGKINSEETVEGIDSIRLEFLGNGDIQKSYKEGAPLQANTGLGVSFQRLWYRRDANNKELSFIQDLSVDFVVNIASTADSTTAILNTENTLQNRRDFGTYLLIPLNSRQAAYLDFNIYFSNNRNVKKGVNDLFRFINGINIRLAGSNNNWVYQKNGENPLVFNATGIFFRGGIFHDFMPDNIRRANNYSITVGANYSFRGLYGDISSDDAEMKTYRLALLGTEQKRWHGWEINLGLRFKNIRAEVQIPVFKAENAGLRGLTDTQFVTSIRFVGGFPLDINK